MTPGKPKSWKKRIAAIAAPLAFVGGVCLPGVVMGAELSETWTSVRALGMGNAYSAVVSDGDSLFYNPAGIARIEGFHWTVFDLHAGLNGMSAVESAQEIAKIDQSNLSSTLDSLYGKPIWAGGGTKTAILAPGFAAAGFAGADAGIFLQNRAYPTLNLNYHVDYGIAIGTGFDIVPQFFKFGIVGRRLNRTGTTLPIGPSRMATLDAEELKDELKRRGTGYGFDMGILLTAPGPIKPSLSFVYKNMGYTTFSHEEGPGAPPRIEPEMVVGAALEIDGPLITITPSVDYRYLNREDIQMGKKLHVGVEVSLPLIDIRAGLNQGYYTVGAGLSLGILQLDVASYGVELGEYPGQHEDRRYVAALTFQLGFDPGKFGFGNGGGSGSGRRHLKQRR